MKSHKVFFGAGTVALIKDSIYTHEPEKVLIKKGYY